MAKIPVEFPVTDTIAYRDRCEVAYVRRHAFKNINAFPDLCQFLRTIGPLFRPETVSARKRTSLKREFGAQSPTGEKRFPGIFATIDERLVRVLRARAIHNRELNL